MRHYFLFYFFIISKLTPLHNSLHRERHGHITHHKHLRSNKLTSKFHINSCVDQLISNDGIDQSFNISSQNFRLRSQKLITTLIQTTLIRIYRYSDRKRYLNKRERVCKKYKLFLFNYTSLLLLSSSNIVYNTIFHHENDNYTLINTPLLIINVRGK